MTAEQTTVIQTDQFGGNSIQIPSQLASSQQPTVKLVNPRKTMNARYELAERTADANEQFGRATPSSGRMVESHADRATMRDRVRHEMHEADPWLHGSARTTVISVIGRGPWLEVKIPDDPDASRMIAEKFNHWFRKRVHGPRKFRTMCWGKQDAGTGLGLLVTDPTVRGPVKLNFVPFEDEQIRNNIGSQAGFDRKNYLLDGKEFDSVGNASVYHICDKHPAEYPDAISKPVSARFVVDIWDQERASQGRGVSTYATATKNGPLRRTYRRATLDSATTAAKISFLLETNVDKFEDGEEMFDDIDPMTGVPMAYGEGMALPKGWKASQLRPEQPTTGHDEFMRSNVSEMGRAAGQPSNVAIGDAKGANYATSQQSRADWADDVDVQRQDWEDLGLDKLLGEWLIEAALVGEIPAKYADIDDVPHEYRWTRRRHQDTNKEYSGRAKAIATGQTSRAFWQTDDGVNPETEDKAIADGFGVTVEVMKRALFLQTFEEAAKQALIENGDIPDDDSDDGETDGEAADIQGNGEGGEDA